jgi:acetyltransferase-like isoleucine patch superfamily enzyme
LAKILKPYPRSRAFTALAISLIPLNRARVWLYKHLLHYEISPDARIGFMTVIACDQFRAGRRLSLGRSNRFIGPFRVDIGDEVIIGRFNLFSCGPTAVDPEKAGMNYARRFVVGDSVLINDGHYFDVYGKVEIGAGTWVAGMGSQFWTHGASVMDRDINIGEGCYLGSAVRFAPGAGLADRCVLGLGSVVVSRIEEDDAVVAGFPAKKIRNISPDDNRQFIFQAD